MAKDVKLVIAANVERAEQEIRKLEATGKTVSDSLGNSFEQLGIRSTMAIEKERAAAISAYDRIKASGVASAQEIARAKEALHSKTSALDSELGKVKNTTSFLTTEFGGLQNVVVMLAGSIGMGSLIKASIDTAMQMERLTTVMKVSTGSVTLAAREMQFIREESQRLGLDMMVTADSYSKFLTAIKGTSAEGETGRKIFIGISEGLAALKKTSDESQRIFAQVQQSMSKGKIELEDMKIIAEAGIPIFQILADSMGKSTGEIMKMMSDGKLLASEVWPRVGEEMHKAFGPAAAEAAKGFQAELNRFNNAAAESKVVLGEALLPVLTDVLKGFSSGGSILKDFIGGIQMTAVEVFGFADKVIALAKNAPGGIAGGLFSGLLFGSSRDRIKQEFATINAAVAEQKQAIFDKLEANVSSQKTASELDAENIRVAAARKKEQADKERQDAEKLANEKKAYEEQLFKNQLQALQDQGKSRLAMLRFQHDSELSAEQDLNRSMSEAGNTAFDQQLANLQRRLAADQEYYRAVIAEEKKASDLQLANASKHIASLQALRGKPGYSEPEKALSLEKDILAAIGAKSKLEMEFQAKRQQATFDAIRSEQALADKISEQVKRKVKEIEDLRLQFSESNRQWSDKKADILGGPDQTAEQKLAAAKDRLIEKEEEYSKVSDPQEKAKRLTSLVDAWSGLTEKIDFSNMNQSQKMMELNKIEDERTRIQETVTRNAENEKAVLIETYDTAVQRVREYKNELQLLDELIKNMSRDVTINLKINKGGAASATASKSAAAGDAVDTTDYSEEALRAAVGDEKYNSWLTQDSGGGSYGGDSYSNDVIMQISSAPSYAVGTNRVPRDGFAYLHKDEAVVPAKYNPAAGGSGSGPISISIGDIVVKGGSTGTETAREIARAIMPELQKLDSRFRRAA